MTKKCIVLYVEGQTDEEFYNRIKDNIKNKIPGKRFMVNELKVVCIKGITKFSSKLLSKFKTEIMAHHLKDEVIVFLCYDNDAFEYGFHPPVDRKKLEEDLYKAGATKVNHIVAKRNIEDWFMIDEQGILKYLRLNKNTKINGSNGLEKIKYLFKCANRVYQKGSKVDGLVDSLDMNLICSKICSEISVLCIELGLLCEKQSMSKMPKHQKEENF